MRHHTKDKGDQGTGFVIADCLQNGIQVATLLSEHLPFDLIAIDSSMNLCRLSVKYRTSKDDCLEVSFRSSWADKKGTHIKPTNKQEFDATAIYCPDTKRCYYLKVSETTDKSFRLRLTPAANKQVSGIRMASDYTDPKRLFES